MATRETTSFTLAFARLFWMVLGPVLLLLFAAGIVTRWGGWVTGLDILFFAVLAGMMLARWAEFRGGAPETASGEPATPAHLRRYLITCAAVGVAVWLLANIVGNRWTA